MTDSPQIAGYRDILTGEREPAPDGGAAKVRGSSAPELKSLLSVVVATLSIAALYFGRDVLIPIVLAIMLSFVLSPLVTLLQRARLPRGVAVLLSIVAALGILGLVGTLIGSQAASLASNAPQYAVTVEQKVKGVQQFAREKMAAVSGELGGNAKPPASSQTALLPTSTGTAPSGAARQVVPVRVVQEGSSPFEIAKAVLEPILGPFETTILVLIVTIFILMQREDLRDRFIRVFGSSDLHRTTMAMDDAATRLSRYFLSQLAVNTCFGLVISLGLWIIGVPSFAMWGVIAGLLRFVPYIGPLIGAIGPAALAAAIEPGWGMTIKVVALFVVVEPLTGYVVEPLLYGHSTGLSPISVIVAAIFWTWVWGPIGLIMSTPLTLILVVTGRHVKSLEFFDVLLGDRPALTLVKSFYQRILANDPDEALAQAEALLSERPLTAYYDDIVLPGLKLAVEDQARGTIDEGRARELTATIRSIVDDLAARAGESADGEANPIVGTIACVAGSGTFDEAVSAMLAQLLEARGASVRVVPASATGRHEITRLDLSGVDVVAVSYLELAGSPAQLRYLLRRLRTRAPEARIVVGLWPAGEAALSEVAIQQMIGADRYVGTLADALDAVSVALSARKVA